MTTAIKLALTGSGLFLFVGLLSGVWKYRTMMASPTHQAPIYVDIAHRAALLYSFAALVMAELLRYSPYSEAVQITITMAPLSFFAIAIGRYFQLGMSNTTENQFAERNFHTTVGTWLLIVAEVGGIGAIVWGFISTQWLA